MNAQDVIESYVRDVARSAQAVKLGEGDAAMIAMTIAPFNRIIREAALQLPFEAEPSGFLLVLGAIPAKTGGRP